MKLRQKKISIREIGFSTVKFAFATLFLILAVQWSKFAVAPFVRTDTGIGLLIQTIVAIIFGYLAYAIVAFILRCEEFKWVIRYLPFIGKRLYNSKRLNGK